CDLTSAIAFVVQRAGTEIRRRLSFKQNKVVDPRRFSPWLHPPGAPRQATRERCQFLKFSSEATDRVHIRSGIASPPASGHDRPSLSLRPSFGSQENAVASMMSTPRTRSTR